MLGLLVCLFLVSATWATEEDYAAQGPVMYLFDSSVPMERSLRSLTKLKERSVSQREDGHFPFYRGLGRK